MIDLLFLLGLVGWSLAGAGVVNAAVGVMWRIAGVVLLLVVALLVPFSGDGSTVQVLGVVLGVLVGAVVAVGRAIMARARRAR